jgi:hypothetical protein
MNYFGYERRACDFCSHAFTPQLDSQRFCGPRCRQQGRALENRAARQVWADAGRPIAQEVREDFERDRGLWRAGA